MTSGPPQAASPAPPDPPQPVPGDGRELGLGLVLLALGGVVLLEIGNIPPPLFETFGAALVPQATAILLIGGALLLVARAGMALARAPRAPAASGPRDWRLAGTVALILAHAGAISFLGVPFIPATAAALFLMFLLLGARGLPRAAASAALALVVAVGLHLVFTRIFQTDLP